MAFDGVLLSNVINELGSAIIDGRIDKIYQPEKDEIILTVRNKGQNLKVLLSATANNPRLHITAINKPNPISPPMFCMVLRKHILNGRITDLTQPSFERIAEISIESMDELGELSTKKLIIEIMGKHSNIILIDHNGKIIDSVKHITNEISRVREVLPGKMYMYPPIQDKRNPLIQDESTLYDILFSIKSNKKPEQVIADNFIGISKVTAKEIAFRGIGIKDCSISQLTNQEREKIIDTFIGFFDMVKNKEYSPVILKDDRGDPKDIFPFTYFQYSLDIQYNFVSISKALEQYYSEKDKIDRLKQRSSDLHKIIKSNLDRCHKKLGLQIQEINEASDSDKYRLWGELITANIYQIPKGVKEVKLLNYYEEHDTFELIPLDPNKTAAQNSAIYFKKYNKLKNAYKFLTKEISETKNEIEYFESQLDNLDKCTEYDEIQEIKDELINEGYIKAKLKNKSSKKVISSPHHFVSSDGFDIYVGKNNRQNDYLTLKLAASSDIWLHTKSIPGSHVIIKANNKKVSDTTLIEAALLAAYFSKGRQSSNVSVDYCPKKNVKKPSGAKPGMVIYENYNTLYVTPSEQILEKVKKG